MYAVIRNSGRQYRAVPGTVITTDRLNLEDGTAIDFNEVLLVVNDNGDATIGKPLVEGAVVKATVVETYRAAKVIVWKYTPKQRYRRRRGSRAYYTRVKIESISL